MLAERAASKIITVSCIIRPLSGGLNETDDYKPMATAPLAEWKATYETLHRWTQIIGKIRLTLTPRANHWWNTTLYVTPRGLTTNIMTYKGRYLQIDFDFNAHLLLIQTTDGTTKSIALRSRSVTDFYQETMAALGSLGMPVTVWTTPVEVQDRTPFEEDQKHATYDPEYAQRVWRILAEASRVFTEFRSRFIGKVSPVSFFGEPLIWLSPAFQDVLRLVIQVHRTWPVLWR